MYEAMEETAPDDKGSRALVCARAPPPLVLSGHTASLTSYQSDTPRPSPRTNRTRRVPHPVLIGHAASLTSYKSDTPARRVLRRRAVGQRGARGAGR